MFEAKQATLDHPVHPLIATRWSPSLFSSRPVAKADLLSIFEAARWAPSSYNEQPWRYLVATQDDPSEFARLLSCLNEGNQAWAQAAPVLALGIVSTRLARNDKPNRVAFHDLGLASATLSLEATARGISVHQMGGIHPERARELYGIPESFEVLTALALGYVAVGEGRFAERDQRPRTRRPLTETVYTGTFGRGIEGEG